MSRTIPTLSICNIVESSHEQISLLRHHVQGLNDLGKPHKHDFYLLFFIENGAGTHFIDFNKYEVNDYQVFFLTPGQVHNWKLNEATTGFQLMFGKELLLKDGQPVPLPFFQQGLTIPYLNLSIEAFGTLKTLLLSLEEELCHTDGLSKEIIILKLHLLLRLLQRLFVSAVPTPGEPEAGSYPSFTALIDKYYKYHSSVKYYADQLHISPNYLNILSVKKFGQPAGVIIRSRIILEAKRLLASTNLSAKEISYELGFSDNAYFSKVFKQHTGKSPQQFRSDL